MVCSELIRNVQLTEKVDFRRFHELHPDGKRLIVGWFKRAWDKKNCQPEESFEPFIFTWIAFNGWAACITAFDNEHSHRHGGHWRGGGWLDALMLDKTICQKFNSLVSDGKSSLYSYANEFHELWPIFKVQELRQRGLAYNPVPKDNRRKVVEYYLSRGIKQFEPQCWERHRDAGENVPVDWPHTLAALYRVRCNLFHGDKARHSEMDQQIVSTAFRVLIHFLDRYLLTKN